MAEYPQARAYSGSPGPSPSGYNPSGVSSAQAPVSPATGYSGSEGASQSPYLGSGIVGSSGAPVRPMPSGNGRVAPLKNIKSRNY